MNVFMLILMKMMVKTSASPPTDYLSSDHRITVLEWCRIGGTTGFKVVQMGRTTNEVDPESFGLNKEMIYPKKDQHVRRTSQQISLCVYELKVDRNSRKTFGLWSSSSGSC